MSVDGIKILGRRIEMKVSLILTLAVTIFMVACSENDEIREMHQIDFKTVSQHGSKANVFGVIGATYSDAEHFGVYAFHNVNGIWDEKPYMDSVDISKVGADWKNADTSYLWPGLGYLTFACYSPYEFGKGSVIADKETGIKFIGFEAPTDCNYQIDLMTADLIKGAKYSGNPVSVVFKHLLSQIRFTVATKENYVGTNIDSIIINNIEIKELKTKADFNVSDSAAWSNHSGATVYRVLDVDSVVNLDKTVKTISSPLLVIPQDASDYKWDTDKDIVEIRYTTVFENGIREIQTKYLGTETEWKKGYIYNYNIVFGQREITFTPEVNPWENGNTNE